MATMDQLGPQGRYASLPPDQKQLKMAQDQAAAYQAQAAALQAAADARPKMAGYISQVDPATGLMKQPFQLSGQYGDINTDALGHSMQSVREQANRTGPSAWANLMMQQQQQKDLQLRNAAEQQARSGVAQGMADLAMRGGASSGARERMATQGARGLNQARLQSGFQSQQNRFNIQSQDEQQRQQMLQALPGMETAALQPQFQNRQFAAQTKQFDISNAINDYQNQNLYNQKKYEELMKGYAADQTANAQANQGGGSWICSEVDAVKPIPEEDKKHLMKLTEYTLSNHKAVGDFYFFRCKPLIKKMKEANANFDDYRELVGRVIARVKLNRLEDAYYLYRDETVKIINQFWPDCDDKVMLSLNAGIDPTLPFSGAKA